MLNDELESRQVLIIGDQTSNYSTVIKKAVDRIIASLDCRNIKALWVDSGTEAYPFIETNMDIDAFLLFDDMELDREHELATMKLMRHIKERQALVPVFLLADRAVT